MSINYAWLAAIYMTCYIIFDIVIQIVQYFGKQICLIIKTIIQQVLHI